MAEQDKDTRATNDNEKPKRQDPDKKANIGEIFRADRFTWHVNDIVWVDPKVQKEWEALRSDPSTEANDNPLSRLPKSV